MTLGGLGGRLPLFGQILDLDLLRMIVRLLKWLIICVILGD